MPTDHRYKHLCQLGAGLGHGKKGVRYVFVNRALKLTRKDGRPTARRFSHTAPFQCVAESQEQTQSKKAAHRARVQKKHAPPAASVHGMRKRKRAPPAASRKSKRFA